MLDRSGVYTIACDRNGRMYVGATAKSFDERWYAHLSYLGTGRHICRDLQADWSAFGSENFSFAPFIICEGKDAFLYERRAIGLLSRRSDLYNGVWKPKLTAIERLEARTGKSFRELMMPYVLQPQSPEAVAIALGLSINTLSIAARKQGFRVVRCRGVRCYDLKDE